jgi:alcohol dehydrogenase
VVVDYNSENFEDLYDGVHASKFDVCFDTTTESFRMAKIIKEGGTIISITGMPILEEIRRIGDTTWILKLFLTRREKRKEFKAARTAKADWSYLFLSLSREDLATLAEHLQSGTIRPVLDGVWDFNSEDNESGWRGAIWYIIFRTSKG